MFTTTMQIIAPIDRDPASCCKVSGSADFSGPRRSGEEPPPRAGDPGARRQAHDLSHLAITTNGAPGTATPGCHDAIAADIAVPHRVRESELRFRPDCKSRRRAEPLARRNGDRCTETPDASRCRRRGRQDRRRLRPADSPPGRVFSHDRGRKRFRRGVTIRGRDRLSQSARHHSGALPRRARPRTRARRADRQRLATRSRRYQRLR